MDSGRRRFLSSSTAALAARWSGARAAAVTVAPAAAMPVAPVSPPPLHVALVAAPIAVGSASLSYDGTLRGPVIRVKKGGSVTVALSNKLAVATSLQWHGLRGLNGVEGATEAAQAIAAGAELTQTFTPLDSGLLWFHPAALGSLPDQAAAGLRGVLIVDEPEPPVADRDVVLLLADANPAGRLTVNGEAAPLRETIVTGGRLRLRLINATSARILVLAVEGAHPKVIAIDGQPSELFAPTRDAVPVGPGARFELMLDAPASAGGTVRLLSRPVLQGQDPPASDELLLEVTTAGAARAPLPPVAALARNPTLPLAIALERSVRATLVIEPTSPAASGDPHWRLNGFVSAALPTKPLLSVVRGSVVTLGFDNRGAVAVPLRVHGHAMRLLHAKDDGWEPYWRDTVILAPQSVTHVAFVADTAGRWLIESASFDQAASGLRSWFLVT